MLQQSSGACSLMTTIEALQPASNSSLADEPTNPDIRYIAPEDRPDQSHPSALQRAVRACISDDVDALTSNRSRSINA